MVEKVTLKAVNSILISQPPPENGKSPYLDFGVENGIKVDYRSFTHVEGVSAKDFRVGKVYIDQYPGVIITSRNAIENYFRLCEEMRIKINPETKYFCTSETVALYLQKFILYRKRKVFFGDGKYPKLVEVINKHKERTDNNFLLPCSDVRDLTLGNILKSSDINFKEAVMFNTVASDLSDLSDVKYDMICFFTPSGLNSLFKNFPDFVQGETRIAIFGNSTAEAAKELGLRVDVMAPSPEFPSLLSAIKKYVEKSNAK